MTDIDTQARRRRRLFALHRPDADAAAWFERIGARTAETYRIT